MAYSDIISKIKGPDSDPGAMAPNAAPAQAAGAMPSYIDPNMKDPQQAMMNGQQGMGQMLAANAAPPPPPAPAAPMPMNINQDKVAKFTKAFKGTK